MKKHHRRPGGFSLVEMVVALVILAISLVGGVVVLAASRRSVVQANFARLATWSAIYQVEYLKTLPWDDGRLADGETVEPLDWTPGATRTTLVTRNYEGAADLLAVRVEVAWGSPSPVILETLVAQEYADE